MQASQVRRLAPLGPVPPQSGKVLTLDCGNEWVLAMMNEAAPPTTAKPSTSGLQGGGRDLTLPREGSQDGHAVQRGVATAALGVESAHSGVLTFDVGDEWVIAVINDPTQTPDRVAEPARSPVRLSWSRASGLVRGTLVGGGRNSLSG